MRVGQHARLAAAGCAGGGGVVTQIPPHIAITYQPTSFRSLAMTTPDTPPQPPAVPDAVMHIWRNDAPTVPGSVDREEWLMQHAAAWGWSQRDEELREAEQRGADAELDGCLDWLGRQPGCVVQYHILRDLRAARRPAPLTLREQALAALHKAPISADGTGASAVLTYQLDAHTFALALQALQEGADS